VKLGEEKSAGIDGEKKRTEARRRDGERIAATVRAISSRSDKIDLCRGVLLQLYWQEEGRERADRLSKKGRVRSDEDVYQKTQEEPDIGWNYSYSQFLEGGTPGKRTKSILI